MRCTGCGDEMPPGFQYHVFRFPGSTKQTEASPKWLPPSGTVLSKTIASAGNPCVRLLACNFLANVKHRKSEFSPRPQPPHEPLAFALKRAARFPSVLAFSPASILNQHPPIQESPNRNSISTNPTLIPTTGGAA